MPATTPTPSPSTDDEQEADESVVEQESPQYRYIAQRRLFVGMDKNGRKVYREYGQEIPEAEGWRGQVRQRYLQEGHIAQVALLPRGRGRPRKD